MNFSEFFGVFFGNTAKEAAEPREKRRISSKSQKNAKSRSSPLQSADKCGIMVENVSAKEKPSL